MCDEQPRMTSALMDKYPKAVMVIRSAMLFVHSLPPSLRFVGQVRSWFGCHIHMQAGRLHYNPGCHAHSLLRLWAWQDNLPVNNWCHGQASLRAYPCSDCPLPSAFAPLRRTGTVVVRIASFTSSPVCHAHGRRAGKKSGGIFALSMLGIILSC